MECTRIVLVRHGQTAGNGASANPVLSGTTDLPLTRIGHRQAEALAQSDVVRAAEWIYASPLQRARVTAEYAARARSAQIVYRSELQEIDCGWLDGMQIDTVRRRCPDLWSSSQAQVDDRFRWPGGESYRDLRDRSVRSIAEIAGNHPGALVLVVTHAGVITQLVGHLRGLAPARWSDCRVGNASISELAWRGVGGTVVYLDRRDHLAAELRT